MTVLVASLFLPYTTSQTSKEQTELIRSPYGNIGLQNAVRSAQNSSSAPFVWIGCIGPSFKPEDRETAEILLKDKACVGVYPSVAQIEGHYRDFCKQVLWKPFHYQFQDYPKGVLLEKLAWESYMAGLSL
jgi:trehalose-6-phosphate synthase